MSKPDTVVTLSDADKEWIHNELSNVHVSLPEIPVEGDYSEVLLELLVCIKKLVCELEDVIDDYKRLHGVHDV